MTPEYLSVSGFAKQTGLADDTIQSYYAKGLLPEPDIYYTMRNGKRPAWTIDTVEHWRNNRPGRGCPGKPRNRKSATTKKENS